MKDNELENRLSAIFREIIVSRNAADSALNLVQDLKQWLTAEDIKEMEAKIKAKKDTLPS